MARNKLGISRHTINLREGDYEFLADFCAGKKICASDICRAQISKVVDSIKARQASVESDPINLEVELNL